MFFIDFDTSQVLYIPFGKITKFLSINGAVHLLEEVNFLSIFSLPSQSIWYEAIHGLYG